MKEALKKVLKSVGIYHPLQSRYRGLLKFFLRTRYKLEYKKFSGSGYVCNSCNRVFSRFADSFPKPEDRDAIKNNHVIAGYGYNIICPGCLCTARERLVLAFLQQMDLTKTRVLHFSPEPAISQYLKERCEVISADLEPGFYRNIDAAVQKQDALQLSFDASSFDLVIANHILEHIPADIKAMQEFFRVLKPGGMAILQVPYMTGTATIESEKIPDQATASRLYGQKDHVRIYNLEDYMSRLRSAGFIVDLTRYEQMSHLYKYAIQVNEDFLKITKPV